jgi:hypothetical protein
MGECTSVAILGVAGAFLFWNKEARANKGSA